jgi:hypothetical protein
LWARVDDERGGRGVGRENDGERWRLFSHYFLSLPIWDYSTVMASFPDPPCTFTLTNSCGGGAPSFVHLLFEDFISQYNKNQRLNLVTILSYVYHRMLLNRPGEDHIGLQAGYCSTQKNSDSIATLFEPPGFVSEYRRYLITSADDLQQKGIWLMVWYTKSFSDQERRKAEAKKADATDGGNGGVGA